MGIDKKKMKADITKKTDVLSDGFLHIEKADLEIDTFAGKRMQIMRYGLVRPLVVTVVVHLLDLDQIVLVEQFRYSALRTCAGWVVEVVAGLVEKGESGETAARREAIEETGYGSEGKITLLSQYYPAVGLSNQLIKSYLLQTTSGSRVGNGGGIASEGEDIRVHHIACKQAMAMLARGEFVDGKTLIALHAIQPILNLQNKDEKNSSL